MKLDAVDLEPNELTRLNSPDSPKLRLSNDDVRISKSIPIVIKYDYIDLDKTAYTFHQPFHHADTKEYFRLMKFFSSRSIDDIEKLLANDDKLRRDLHFRRTAVSGKLRYCLNQLFSDYDQSIIIYHFALYTATKSQSDRAKDIRSPRIYFMLGNNAFIYPLFFDPYHEINPQPK